LKTILIAIGIALLVIFISFLLYSRFIGTKGLFVKEYQVKSENLPSHFTGLKIVHFSDLHYGKFLNENKIAKVVTKINQLNPDVIVFTGDLIEDDLEKEEQEHLISKLSQLEAKLGKYAISGNHDLEYQYFTEIIEKSGFILLDDKTELIYQQEKKPIIIHGMSSNLEDQDPPKIKLNSFYDFLEETESTYKILILHEPDYIADFNHPDFDLILAGHSHRGQVRLPIIGPIFLPKGAQEYYDEHYQFGNTEMFVSSGIGNSIINFRLFNRPSINFYRLTN